MKNTTRMLIVGFLSLRAITLLLAPSQTDLEAGGGRTRQAEQHLEQAWVK